MCMHTNNHTHTTVQIPLKHDVLLSPGHAGAGGAESVGRVVTFATILFSV